MTLENSIKRHDLARAEARCRILITASVKIRHAHVHTRAHVRTGDRRRNSSSSRFDEGTSQLFPRIFAACDILLRGARRKKLYLHSSDVQGVPLTVQVERPVVQHAAAEFPHVF